jgi:small subunit ribosomal protein S5
VDEQQQMSSQPQLLDNEQILLWETGLIDPKDLDLREEIIRLNRVAKVVKGGRRFSFSAIVVVGNGHGIAGYGKGKAKQVPDAIGKAVESAKRNLIRITRVGSSIPHEVVGEYGSARVLLRPAAEGTGVIAGAAVRAVLDLAGIANVLTKSMGSDNVVNVVKATFEALKSLVNVEHTARLRGKNPEELVSRKYRAALHDRMRESMPKVPEQGELSVSARLAMQEAAGREQMASDADRGDERYDSDTSSSDSEE